MQFWDSSVITGLTDSVYNSVSKAQYKMDNTWSDCVTVSGGNEGDRKYFIFEVPSWVNGTITGLRLVDSSLNVIGEKTVNITKTASRGFSFTWVDQLDTGNKYTITDNPDNTKAIEYAGEITRQGTPVNAENLNHMEQGIYDAHENKVDKETGKGLSTNDYTTEEKTKLAGLSNYDDTVVNNAMVRADSPDADGLSQLYKTVNGQRMDISPKTSRVDELTDETFAAKMDEQIGALDYIAVKLGCNPWLNIQSMVRNGTFANFYSVGDQLTVKYNGNDTLWDIVAIDVATPADTTKTHSVTLMPHNIFYDTKVFDAPEPNNPNSGREEFGNNRYAHSAIRQWLNSSANAGSWWIAQHEYDAAPDYATTADGFMKGFDANFLDVIGETKIKVVIPTVDGGGYEELVDKFYLPSTTEVGLANENDIAEGALLPYFTDNASRIKYKEGTYSVGWWWLRTPKFGSSYDMRNVDSSGASGIRAFAYVNSGVSPVCNII